MSHIQFQQKNKETKIKLRWTCKCHKSITMPAGASTAEGEESWGLLLRLICLFLPAAYFCNHHFIAERRDGYLWLDICQSPVYNILWSGGTEGRDDKHKYKLSLAKMQRKGGYYLNQISLALF